MTHITPQNVIRALLEEHGVGDFFDCYSSKYRIGYKPASDTSIILWDDRRLDRILGTHHILIDIAEPGWDTKVFRYLWDMDKIEFLYRILIDTVKSLEDVLRLVGIKTTPANVTRYTNQLLDHEVEQCKGCMTWLNCCELANSYTHPGYCSLCLLEMELKAKGTHV